MKFKKPTSLFKCWLRNRNFTQNTLDTRCQIKSPMWPHKIWRLGGVNRTGDLPLKSPSTIYPKSSVRFTPNRLYDLPPQNRQGRFAPQIAKYDLPPRNRQGRFAPQIAEYDLPPPQIVQFWAKFQTHNIMLCFTKVFSAKDQSDPWSVAATLYMSIDVIGSVRVGRFRCWSAARCCHCDWL